MFQFIALLTATFLIAGCSSLHDRAREQYDNGDYNAASATYDRILSRDPNDGEALEQRRRTRQKLFEQQLIEVRQLRLSENQTDAHAKLKKIIRQQNQWQMTADGAAFSAQTEELEYFYKWLTEQASRLIKEEKFLNAKLLLRENEDVLVGSNYAAGFQRYAARVDEGGGRHCRKIKSMVAGHYSNEFWQHYCVYWGQAMESKSPKSAPHGFGSIALSGKIDGMPPELLETYSEKLLSGLRESPLYQADGKALPVKLSGTFESKYSETRNIAIHSYNEDIPYQDTETVSYTDREPYTAYRDKVIPGATPGSTQTIQEPYTEYRDVTKYRQQPVTRYRQEARTLPYTKMDFTADYRLTSKIEFKMDGTQYSIPVANQLHKDDYYHEVSNPRIGLHPRRKDLVTEVDWVKLSLIPLTTTVRQQVRTAWENKYCNFKESGSGSAQAEGILRCAAGGNDQLTLVDNWSMELFDLPFVKVKQTIGL